MILPDLRARDTVVRESMDDPHCDPAMLERTYAQFGVVNALVAGWRRTYRHQLRPLLSRGRGNTLLDIGSGGGDVARSIAGWARRDGFALDITAADPDERAHAWALGRQPSPGLEFRQAFSSDLVAEGRTFDVVISNHLLHHLDDEQFSSLLDDSEKLVRLRAVHSDIHRSRAAYVVFSNGTRPVFRRSFIRADGLASIRRSYTASELRAAAPPGWRVQRQAPWRNLLIHDAADAVGV